MLELDKADLATFAPCAGQVFELISTAGRLPLTLAEVRPLGAGFPGAARAPFALTFHGPMDLRLPQRIYRLENATLGALEIFLVPLGADASGAQFEAIFN